MLENCVPHLLVKEQHCIQGLILGAGGDIRFGKPGQKVFKLLFSRHGRRQRRNMQATASQPGTVKFARS